MPGEWCNQRFRRKSAGTKGVRLTPLVDVAAIDHGNDWLDGEEGNDTFLILGKSQSAQYGEQKVANDYEWRRVA